MYEEEKYTSLDYLSKNTTYAIVYVHPTDKRMRQIIFRYLTGTSGGEQKGIVVITPLHNVKENLECDELYYIPKKK